MLIAIVVSQHQSSQTYWRFSAGLARSDSVPVSRQQFYLFQFCFNCVSIHSLFIILHNDFVNLFEHMSWMTQTSAWHSIKKVVIAWYLTPRIIFKRPQNVSITYDPHTIFPRSFLEWKLNRECYQDVLKCWMKKHQRSENPIFFVLFPCKKRVNNCKNPWLIFKCRENEWILSECANVVQRIHADKSNSAPFFSH